MRFPILFTILLLAGCAASKAGKSAASPPPSGRRGNAPKPLPPIINPAYGISGKIALVNDTLRYVVIDFTLSRRPAPDTRLNVFRGGQKVGEVKISEQAQENNVAADITAGEVKVGDEVRDN